MSDTYTYTVEKQPNGELLVAVDHNQLRPMASETVDPIDWLHHPPSWAVPPQRLVLSINRCSSETAVIRSCNLQHARQPPCLCGHSGHNVNHSGHNVNHSGHNVNHSGHNVNHSGHNFNHSGHNVNHSEHNVNHSGHNVNHSEHNVNHSVHNVNHSGHNVKSNH